jgi:F-type H+-transporting ATPase subunit a
MDTFPEGFLRIFRDIPSVQSQTVFEIGGFPIVNSTLSVFLISVIIGLFGFFIVRRFTMMPSAFQNAVEAGYESLLKLVDQITNDSRRTKMIFPLVGSLAIYIFIANFFGLIPFITSITYNGVQLFRGPTADFNTPFGLALGAIILLQYVSIKEWGLLRHIGKYIKIKEVFLGFKKGIKEGIMAIIEFLIGLLDIISEFAKVISLSLRLFGNMYAGEVLTTIILGAFAYGLPAVYLAMSFLTATVQAVVFASLVAAYYMLSVKPLPPAQGT